MAASSTITVPAPITPAPTSLQNATSNATVALIKYGRLRNAGADAIIVRRTDHPHVDGNYYYAIRRDAKHGWTGGESVLSVDEIADLWYSEDCPRP